MKKEFSYNEAFVLINLINQTKVNGFKLNRSRNRNKEKLTKKIEEFQEDLKTSKPKDVETIEAIAENERTKEQIEVLNKWNKEVEKLASEKFEIELQTFDFDKADELNPGADSNVFNSVEFFLIDKED